MIELFHGIIRMVIVLIKIIGGNIDDFVMVKENGKWLIYRISAADVGQDKATANLSCPSSITVYFNKAANVSYYKMVRKELDFNTNLKGV